LVTPEWSSSHRRKIKSEIEIPNNKVMITNPDTGQSYQKVIDVPVYSDSEQKPLAVYEINIDAVSYNFDNIRLWKYKIKKCREKGIDTHVGLEAGNIEHEKIIQDILLNTKPYSNVKAADLKEDMVKKGQEDPALITPEGIMWNGNRRCAIIRDLFDNGYNSRGLRIQAGDGKWSRIKVALLPDGMDTKQLRELEKRLQEEPRTEEDYGRVNEMGDIHDYVDEYNFANGNYFTATPDEKNKIVKEYKKTEWGTWNKIVKAKKTIDIMNEYLESRDTDENPLIGNYEVIENNEGGVTWFENLVALLDEVEEKYQGEADVDTKIDQWKASQFSAYETGEVEQKKIRNLTNIVKKATGNQAPDDTTSLLATHVNNDPIISNWGTYSNDPSSIIHDREIAKAAAANLAVTSRTFDQLGNTPKLVIQGILSDLDNLNSNLIESNDQELVKFIEKCEKRLAEYKQKAKS
jgi:hypothetical protein